MTIHPKTFRIIVALTVLAAAALLAPAITAQSFKEETIQTVLASPQNATISSPIRAKIAQLDLYNGDTFEAGQNLIRFDCSIEESQLGQARAKLEAAQATLEAREKLNELESISELDIKLGRAEKLSAEASVAEFTARVGQCDFKAPFKGRITERLANPHEFAESSQPLIRIASLERLQAQILVPSLWLSWLDVGSELTLKIMETNGSYPARIIRVGGEIDPVSQSIPVVAQMEQDHDELLPGMSGAAVFKVLDKDDVTPPKAEQPKDKAKP